MDPVSRGISVVEIPPRGQVIPVERVSVAAFIGPAPRGPVNIPVAVHSLEEFLARFSVPGYPSRTEFLLYQYFENGGREAVVVRVSRSARCNQITLPGLCGDLKLEARNPGPLEHLRASVDHDGTASADRLRFNLVIHRCRSPSQPLVEEQEVYQGLSLQPGHAEFIGTVLERSGLVRLAGPLPAERPTRTVGSGNVVNYVYGRWDWQGDNAPTDYDLIGSREESTGLFALEQVPWVDFVTLVPGATGATLGPVALFAADGYCRERSALLLLDPPGSWGEVDDAVRVQRKRDFTSPNAITYFPALESPPHGDPRGHLSAAGAIAGALAAWDLATVKRPLLSLGRSRPVLALEEGDVHQLGRLGVNTLVRSAGKIELAGLTTMARSGGPTPWNSLRQRRIALIVMGGVLRYTRWAAFEPGGDQADSEVQDQLQQYLAALRARGLLAGAEPREAFFVRCERRAAGSELLLTITVGLALNRPGEFVAFEVSHAPGMSLSREITWKPGLALAG
ncbi:MAG: hypothetical protein FJ197_04185 [Gammaproteobacteria bacterium]|nr:hypothetical protein [Gammaproteobacteria bacterium]